MKCHSIHKRSIETESSETTVHCRHRDVRVALKKLFLPASVSLALYQSYVVFIAVEDKRYSIC